MFIQPFDTSLSMWLVSIPRFELVPVAPPPPAPGCNGEGGTEPAAAGEGDAPAPQMRLVMTGFDCCAYRVWNAVPNMDWSAYMEAQQPPGDPREQDRHEAPPPRRLLPEAPPQAADHAAADTQVDKTGGPAR